MKAIVSEYTTKEENANGYEAHREWIDIQYLLKGNEKICCLPLECLKETKAYDAGKDAAFYEEAGVAGQEMMLGHWLKNSRRTLSSLDGCKVNQILLNNKEIIIKHSTLLRRNSAAAPVNIRKKSPQTINAIH